ncbi:MAG: cyclic lactone autoinducer peptide [Bacillota bacterium]
MVANLHLDQIRPQVCHYYRQSQGKGGKGMKRLLYSCLPAIFTVLVAVAKFGVGTACIRYLYQPEVPKALRK